MTETKRTLRLFPRRISDRWYHDGADLRACSGGPDQPRLMLYQQQTAPAWKATSRNLLILLWLVCSAVLMAPDAVAIDEVPQDPGKLSALCLDSDSICVALFSEIPVASTVGGPQDLTLTVNTVIKGDKDLKVVRLKLTRGTRVYGIVHGSTRVLLFLKKTDTGELALTTGNSALQLEGVNLDLAEHVSEYIRILLLSKKHERASAMTTFISKILTTAGDSYIKHNVAEELLESLQNNGGIHIDDDMEALILESATKSESYKVAVPLALVLEAIGSKYAVPACLHALINTDALAGDINFRLAPILASRKPLLDGFVAEIIKQKDSDKVAIMLTQLYLVPEVARLDIYRAVWRKNKHSRQAIRDLLSRPSSSPGCKEALNGLENEKE